MCNISKGKYLSHWLYHTFYKRNFIAVETIFCVQLTVYLLYRLAPICAATTYLGQLGLLNSVKHTSADLNYLKAVAPNYSGEEYYQNALAVTDNNIITANGIAPIEFACEIFKFIGLYSDEQIEKWFQLFKNGIWSE